MKMTGIAVAVIGVIILLLVGITMVQSAETPAGSQPHLAADWLWLPAAVGAASVIAGAAIIAFGGQSYIVTRNPAVRTEV